MREIELQMVSAISFSWFADFSKTLTIIQCSSQSVYSDKWKGRMKYPELQTFSRMESAQGLSSLASLPDFKP